MSDEVTQWAVVELFGHTTLTGKVTKDTSLFPMLRIDVPATSTTPEFTAEYGVGAIYGIRYVSEEVARRVAETLKENPVKIYAPDLVTREQFDEAIAEYRKRLQEARALTSGSDAGHLDDFDRFKKDDIGDEEEEF